MIVLPDPHPPPSGRHLPPGEGRGASGIQPRTAEARAELSDLRGGLHQRFAARQSDRCKRNKIQCSRKTARECLRNRKHSLFSSVQIVENPKVFKRAAALLLRCAAAQPPQQLLRGGSTRRFFAQLRSVGSKKAVWRSPPEKTTALAAAHGSQKPYLAPSFVQASIIQSTPSSSR